MEKANIYVEFSDELQKLIQDNSIDVAAILRDESIEGEVSYQPIPYQDESGERSKDVALVILASSAAILAIGTALSQVIKAIYRKPYFVEYHDLVEVRDAKGKIIMDALGYPILKLVKKHELIEPREEASSSKLEANLSPSGNIAIKFTSTEDHMRHNDN